MSYTFLWANITTPINTADLDVAFSETANGLFSVATSYASGTIGAQLQATNATAAQALAAIQAYPAASKLVQTNNGVIDSSLIVMPNGQTLAQWYSTVTAQLAGGANVPTANAPTISGNAVVGSTLTATAGAITTTPAGHANVAQLQWFKQSSNVPIAAISGANTTTYKVPGSDIGYFYSVTETPVDSVTGAVGKAVSSTLTAAVTGQIPVITANTPTITPAGTQLYSQVLTCSNGTCSLANCTFAFQWYDNGVAVGSRSTTNTFTPGSTRQGHNITCDVQPTSNLGVVGAIVAANNVVSIFGTANVVATVLPYLIGTSGGNVSQGLTYTVNPATWTQGGNVVTPSSRNWDYYQAANASAPYGNAPLFNSSPNYTQNDFNPTFWPVGSVEAIVENATINGQVYSTSLTGANRYTVQNPPAALSAFVNTGTVTATQGQTLSPVIPVVGRGGTAPYTYSINPSASPFSYAASSGTLSGTSNNVGTTTETVTVTDSTGNTATATFTLQVQSSVSIPIASSIVVNQPFASQAGNLQFGNEYPLVNTIPETGFVPTELNSPYQVPNVASLPGAGNNRFFKTTLGGRAAIVHCCEVTDPQLGGTPTSGYGWRCDVLMGGDNAYNSGDTIWMAVRGFTPSAIRNNPNIHGVLMDIHGSNVGAGMYFSWEGSATGYSLSGNNGMWVSAIRDISAGDTTPMEVTSAIPVDTWFDLVIKMTFSATAGQALTAVWVNPSTNPTLVASTTDANATGPSDFPCYPKAACYSAPPPPISGGNYWGYSSMIVVRDNGYTPQQIQALLT